MNLSEDLFTALMDSEEMMSAKIKLIRSLLLMTSFIAGLAAYAQGTQEAVRVGVLKFGTVNWELQAIKSRALDKKNNLSIEIVPLGSKNATHVALQGKAVDIIVTDWVWVSRQRQQGRDYTFVPHSTAVGSVMVKNDSSIKSISDLKGMRLGVAGGQVDKSWILLNAYAQKNLQLELTELVDENFAAPPLLNELFVRDEFDAVLNFWHYASRLQADGNRVLLGINEILPALGIDNPLPMIGWVFSESWADSNPHWAQQFVNTSAQAKQIMLKDDQVWEELKPMMKVDNDEIFTVLKRAYRQGIPGCFGPQDLDSIGRAYALLVEYGGEKLAGDSTDLAPGTIWKHAIQNSCD